MHAIVIKQNVPKLILIFNFVITLTLRDKCLKVAENDILGS